MFDINLGFCDDEIVEQKQPNQTSVADLKSAENVTSPKQKLPIMIMTVVAIVICLVAVGVVGYYLMQSKNIVSTPIALPSTNSTQTAVQPTTTPLTTWKTHENTKYNFSINYSDNWNVREFEGGAAFNPILQPGYPDKSDSISASTGPKLGNYVDLPFEEYAKKAGEEIQSYGDLASVKKVTTLDGVVGYETTWMVESFLGRGTGSSESLPITYFELPNDKSQLLRVTLDRKEDLEIYEKMLLTIKFNSVQVINQVPIVDDASVLKTVIAKYIAQKGGSDENSVTISVSTVEGNYAKGMVSFKDEMGGGLWFAAKEDGVWKLVWDGNGIIKCSDLTLYPEFSKKLIPQCFDDTTQGMVER